MAEKYHIEGDTLIINDGVTTIEKIDFHTYNGNGTSLSEYDGLKDEKFQYVKKLVLPDSVTKIGDDAFFDFPSLEDITLPNGITNTGSFSFNGCENLKSITIPNSVTRIEDGTFMACESLTSIIIPDGVTSIGIDAFYGCERLTDITIPSSVTSIGLHSFLECDNLTIRCNKGSCAEKYAKENNIPCSYIEQDKKNENKQQTVIKGTERTPANPIKNGDIVRLTNFGNLYGMVSGMNEDHIFVLDCNGNERRVKRSEESVLKPVKSSPAIKKAFCEMLDQIEMRQQIRDDIYNLEEQESECDSKIADNATLLYSLLSGKGKNNRDIER